MGPVAGIRRAAVAAAICLIAAVAGPQAASAAPQSQGQGGDLRFGVYIFNEPFNDVEFRRLREAGGRLIRTTFLWADVQRSYLPAYDWSDYDPLVARASRHGVSILPVLIGSPQFAAPVGAKPPTEPVTKFLFARYAAAAAERYGHGGEFWKENPDLPYAPIEAWEVWNEPNIRSFWTVEGPDAGEYAELLKLLSKAIRGADPRAQVMLAGLTTPRAQRATPATEFLTDLYRVPGFRQSFDVGAVHPYASDVPGVEREIAALRAVMDRHGDARKPLAVTEVGWSSAGIEHYMVKDPATQARLTGQAIEMLEERREEYRLGDVIWFRWQDPEGGCPKPGGCWYDQAGLFTVDGRPKPAWSAFARAVGGRAQPGPLPPALVDELLAAISGG